MITSTSLGSHGRLGNQFFQYAALFSLGLQKGYEICIPDFQKIKWHKQANELQHFNLSARRTTRSDLLSIKHEYTEPNYLQYDPNFFDLSDYTNITGFFQNLRYFYEYREPLLREFSAKEEFANRAHRVIEDLGVDRATTPLVALHVRLGDGVDPRLNRLGAQARLHAYQSGEFRSYLTRALSHLPLNSHVIVFTGGRRSSRRDRRSEKLAAKITAKYDMSVMPSKDPLTDFLCLTMADHIILSYDSTYGWWGAFLNRNPNKLVVAPQRHFLHAEYGVSGVLDRPDYYPPNWTIC